MKCSPILRTIRNFVRNGFHVFSMAARGEYEHMSPQVRMLCEELAQSSDGKQRLRRDRSKIYRDVSASFEECKLRPKNEQKYSSH